MTLSLGPCVFPFSYKGEVHERCSCKDAPACWCPTSLNDNREPAVTDYCKGLLEGSVPEVSPPAFGADAATTVDGVPCVFPFRLGDVIYTRCTEASRGAPWCATQVDAALRPVRSGFCKGTTNRSLVTRKQITDPEEAVTSSSLLRPTCRMLA
ncbi:72 kDa type IV collagenase-like [Penaeus indicus]|uniref:72 kDa type IV collagenase-like n=1 Tax=Penaeus indicus TaxID=29960 RepID=UPI00300C00A6